MSSSQELDSGMHWYELHMNQVINLPLIELDFLGSLMHLRAREVPYSIHSTALFDKIDLSNDILNIVYITIIPKVSNSKILHIEGG